METYEEWLSRLQSADDDTRREILRDKILESDQLDDESKKIFKDSFEYVKSLVKRGKPFETNLFKIHLMEVKGYEKITFAQLSRILMLLTLCGFKFDLKNETNSNK